MGIINLLFVFLLLGFISSDVHGQQYVPTILVEYDNAGNRVLRKLENVCYGCPKPAPPGTDRPYREPGIEHITTESAGQFRLHPNPFDADLKVTYTGWTEGINATVKVYDISGKLVLVHPVRTATETIHFTNMASGTYMVYYYEGMQLRYTWKATKKTTL